ncbi:MAG TPA: hypothetical protein VNY84_00445 [Acidimicrobiales bacterium]|jgi:hypothetical protein|nr:hypothetical protein [Acidimicrobiales bacterium]
MAQPEYVPTLPADQTRVSERLPVPASWRADRPAEVVQRGGQPLGKRFGVIGPDQGYAIKLAHLFEDKLVLTTGEHRADVVAGGVCVATKRAAILGRAPVIYDLEVGFAAWGYLTQAPADLLAYRKPLFAECAHHYEQQRAIADQVPESTLRLAPADVRARVGAGGWKALLGLS